MKNKYKTRAEEIFNNIEWVDPVDSIPWLKKDCIIEAMCQLAEEVEKYQYYLNIITNIDFVANIYIKEQVEELLEKQRELCAKEAKMTGIAYGNDKSISDYEVNKDSILNAKLKLD